MCRGLLRFLTRQGRKGLFGDFGDDEKYSYNPPVNDLPLAHHSIAGGTPRGVEALDFDRENLATLRRLVAAA